MNITSRILVIGVSLSFMLLILDLVRRKKLKEKYAILWLTLGVAIFILASYTKILKWVTSALGIILPVNAVFFFGILFILLINLHFSLVISNLSEQNTKIVQKLALLESKLKDKY